MRKIAAIAGLIFLSGPVIAAPDMTAAITALNKLAGAKVAWNTAQAKQAEVTCDGRPDTVMFGTSAKTVWVGVFSSTDGKAYAARFPLDGKLDNGFCAKPTSIKFYPQDCGGPDETRLEDCKPSKSCKIFQLDAGDCDPFNFYWDAHHRFTWWRN